MIAQCWPCWLSTILAFDVRLATAYVALAYRACFSVFDKPQNPIPWLELSDLRNLKHWPVAWDHSPVLVSGTKDFLTLVMSKIKGHVGIFIHAMAFIFTGHRMRLTTGLYEKWGRELWVEYGLSAATVVHADFGGVTSAHHLIAYRGVDETVFTPKIPLRRKLAHIIQPALPTRAQEITAPETVENPFPREPWPTGPIYRNGLLHPEGLLDVTRPKEHIACRSVFKQSGWVRRALMPAEWLRAYDMPLCLDEYWLSAPARRWAGLWRFISPIISGSICRSMWSGIEGGLCGEKLIQPSRERLELPMDAREGNVRRDGVQGEEKTEVSSEGKGNSTSISKENVKSRSSRDGDDTSLESVEPRPILQAMTVPLPVSNQSTVGVTMIKSSKIKYPQTPFNFSGCPRHMSIR